MRLFLNELVVTRLRSLAVISSTLHILNSKGNLITMSTEIAYPHLTIDDCGQVKIGTSRYKVIHLAAEHYQHGWTAEEILRQHPDLRPEEVYSALTYFYDHRSEMIAELKSSLSAIQGNPPAQPFSRDELLIRRAAEAK